MAKGTGARRHTHKYFRLVIDGLWHCGNSKCTHFMPGNMPPPVGKDSICWSCGRPFELNLDNMVAFHPVCDACPPYDAPVLSREEMERREEILNARMAQERMRKLLERGSEPEADEIESTNADDAPVTHKQGCPAWLGGDCTCGADELNEETK